MRSRTKLLMGVLVGVVLLGLALGGFVLAQAPTATPTAGDDTRCPCGGRPGAWQGRGGMLGGRFGGGSLVEFVAKELKIDASVVTSELASGKTLEQVVKDHNGNVTTIVDAFVAAQKANIEALLNNMRDKVTKQMSATPPAFGGIFGREGMMAGRWGAGSLVDLVAKQLNIEVSAVTADLAAGKSLEQIIKDHNGNVTAVVDAAIAERKASLDELVKNGRLTQAQEDTMLASMREQVTKQLSGTPHAGGKGWNKNDGFAPQGRPFGPGMKGGMRGGMRGALPGATPTPKASGVSPSIPRTSSTNA